MPAPEPGAAESVEVPAACAAGTSGEAPDLLVSVTDFCVADCDDGPAELAVQITNQGALAGEPGSTLAVYTRDAKPRLITTIRLPGARMCRETRVPPPQTPTNLTPSRVPTHTPFPSG